MAKYTKISIGYSNGDLPENFSNLLKNADEGDLRVLAAVLMLSLRESVSLDPKGLPETLGMEKADVDASLKFWRGAGILKNESAKSAEPAASSKKTAQKTSHRGGAVERSGSLGEYTSAELATLMEQRRVSAELVDEAQRIYGKIFRAYDTGILVGIVDQLGFDEEAVLAILAYSVRRGKKTLRYAERVAMAFYDEGITDTGAVLERIHRMEQASETVEKIKSLFGIGSRELTTTEKKLFGVWTEQFCYDIDVIRLAYDITVDTIQKPVPKYAGSILESWHKEGLRTEDEVLRYIEAQKAQKKTAEASEHTPKSYDLDEFFEAALQRGLKDLS